MSFPASPTNGQVYQGKVYNSTTNTWDLNNYSGIYDSGSNTNGNWIRYIDGTMECWGNYSFTVPAIATNVSNSSAITPTFPMAFISKPTITTEMNVSYGEYFGHKITEGLQNLTGFTLYLINLATGSTPSGIVGIVGWRAMGKWSSGASVTQVASIIQGIYDSGSNANGNWIRYTDGTMECWNGVASMAISQSTGTVPTSISITYPQTFLASLLPVFLATAWPLESWTGFSVIANNSSSATANIAIINTSIAQSVQLEWRAIGKWSTTAQTSLNTYNITTTQTLIRAVYAGSTTVVPVSSTATYLNASTLIEDTNNAVTNPSTIWTFTAPVSGVYTIDYSTTSTVASTTNGFLLTNLWKNGSFLRLISKTSIIATQTGCESAGSCTERLAMGDYVQINYSANNNTSGNIATTRICVTQVGK